jgi:hypothetical protein
MLTLLSTSTRAPRACRSINLNLKRLSATTVIAGGVAVRRKTDGQELERAGVVYLLHKTDAGWQFATVVIDDAVDALRPE